MHSLDSHWPRCKEVRKPWVALPNSMRFCKVQSITEAENVDGREHRSCELKENISVKKVSEGAQSQWLKERDQQ